MNKKCVVSSAIPNTEIGNHIHFKKNYDENGDVPSNRLHGLWLKLFPVENVFTYKEIRDI